LIIILDITPIAFEQAVSPTGNITVSLGGYSPSGNGTFSANATSGSGSGSSGNGTLGSTSGSNGTTSASSGNSSASCLDNFDQLLDDSLGPTIDLNSTSTLDQALPDDPTADDDAAAFSGGDDDPDLDDQSDIDSTSQKRSIKRRVQKRSWFSSIGHAFSSVRSWVCLIASSSAY
jgi:hypothetical protein